MRSIVFIVGARPNYMKAFPVFEALKETFHLTLIHTGQHFDEKMSHIFFEELKFPKPDIHLSLEKNTKAGKFDERLYIHNKEYLLNKKHVIQELLNSDGNDMGQLGEIRDKLKAHFETLKPDMVMVFGDVTSTLAASLSATMLHIPVVHVESGLRSFDLTMPEEVNRLLVDFLSTFLFVTEQSGVENLQREGITKNVFLVGNTMIDTQKKYLQQALSTQYHKKLGLNEKEYVLVTLHRPSNVDNIDTFNNICRDLISLSKKHKIVYPLHPRTRQNLEKTMYGRQFTRNTHILLEEPLGYLELTCLLAHCTFIITDSGGLQEESTGLGVPCFTLRENTERPSTLIENGGTNQLIHQLSDIQVKKVCVQRLPFWDGYTARHIQHILTTG